jgi:hypothetical protein
MPHQCTNCERVFADGSKEMLSGCPDCGGNKFQFKPASATRRERTPPSDDATRSAPTAGDSRSSGETTSSDRPAPPSSAPGERPSTSSEGDTAGATRRPDAAGDSSTGSPESSGDAPSTPGGVPAGADVDTDTDTDTGRDTDAEVERGTGGDGSQAGTPPAEDYAQASARTDMVSADELADAASPPSRSPSDEVDGRVIEPQDDDRPGLDELREELNSQFESIKIVNPGQYELNLMELYDRQEYIISLQEDGRYVIEVPDSWGDRDDE